MIRAPAPACSNPARCCRHRLGRARTREVKLAVFFTQDKLDEDGGVAGWPLQFSFAAGHDMKVVQDTLGLSSITIAADTYTSVLPQLARQSAEDVAALIRPASPPASRRRATARPGSEPTEAETSKTTAPHLLGELGQLGGLRPADRRPRVSFRPGELGDMPGDGCLYGRPGKSGLADSPVKRFLRRGRPVHSYCDPGHAAASLLLGHSCLHVMTHCRNVHLARSMRCPVMRAGVPPL
jgi:hypothetical protein